MEGTMLSLNSDLEHSSKCFATYRKYARRPETKESWTRRVLSSSLSEMLKDCVTSRPGARSVLRALGIGSGSGEVEYWMLSELRSSFPKITNLSVEPSAEELSRYKEHVAAHRLDLAGVTFDWRQQTLKAYRQSGNDASLESEASGFHLITAIHSLYYEPDLESSLEFMYDRLALHGVMVIALDSDEHGFGQFRSQLPLAWDEHYHYISSNHIKNYLDKRNIPYTIITRPSHVNIAKCFYRDSPEDLAEDSSERDLKTSSMQQSQYLEDGAMLLDFIFQVSHFDQSVPAVKQQELLRLLTKACKVTVDGSEMLLDCDTEYVIVVKNK